MNNAPDLDLDLVRQQFPAFDEPSLEGWSFFENAGGSYVCRQVIDRLTRYYRETRVQPYGVYPASQRAGEMMDDAHERLAEYLDVSADEVHFGPSTSQNTYVLARALRPHWNEGDEIIVTEQDHEANSGVWRQLADTGIVVREWQVEPDTGLLDVGKLDAMINLKTRLIAFPHCSNIVGEINPVSQIATRAHRVGAITVVDGVSYTPHGLPDVEALDADVYLFSLYKVYGPHQGVMVVRQPWLERMHNQSHYFNADAGHKKLVPAGPDHAQVAAATGVTEYFDLLHRHHYGDAATHHANADARERLNQRRQEVQALLRRQEIRLLDPLLSWIKDSGRFRLIGSHEAGRRAPTLSLQLTGNPRDAARRLAAQRIMAGAGHFYAPRLLKAIGIDPDQGVLRISFVHYTSADDIARLQEALDSLP
ncbi:MAG: nitrogen fixation protein NifS [Gammaproteobacteria bacterium]|nr:MAG: nitrogen fixation protein NifS [Gammaproteobacteria bacterium]